MIKKEMNDNQNLSENLNCEIVDNREPWVKPSLIEQGYEIIEQGSAFTDDGPGASS